MWFWIALGIGATLGILFIVWCACAINSGRE